MSVEMDRGEVTMFTSLIYLDTRLCKKESYCSSLCKWKASPPSLKPPYFPGNP